MNTVYVAAAGAVVLLLLVVALLAAIRAFYVVPTSSEVLVRTGGSKPTVSVGAMWVIPLLHQVTRVPTQAVRVPITRVGEDALPTKDKIPAEMQGELLVRVDPSNPDLVLLAAQAIGGGASTGRPMVDQIKIQIDSLVTDALRTAAFHKTFVELNAQKNEFTDEVSSLIQEDLAKLGLTLTAVTVPVVRQGAFSQDEGDVFVAEGQRSVAETVARAKQETNQITRAAEISTLEQDVSARQKALHLEQTRATAESAQALEVERVRAEQATMTARIQAEQESQRIQTRIAQEKASKEAEIQQEKEVSLARIAAQTAQRAAAEQGAQSEQEAVITRERAIAVAQEERQKAVTSAAIDREVSIAAKRGEEAEARAAQATAEGKQQEAEQQVLTIKATAEAERTKAVSLVGAQQEAERAKITAERDAQSLVIAATAERDRAMRQAEARKAVANGEAEALLIAAKSEAEARLVRASADAESADKEASAKIKLAEALQAEGAAKAESEALLVAARNQLDTKLIARDVALAFIEQAPKIAHEIMAPITKVSDVRVLQVQGLSAGEGGGSIPGAIMQAGMSVSGLLPLVQAGMTYLQENQETLATSLQDLRSVLTPAPKQTIADLSSGD